MADTFHLKTKFVDAPECRFYKRRTGKGKHLLGIKRNGEYGWEPLMDVTIELGDPVPENCIAIKSYSENEGLLEYLQGLGLITKVLCYVHSGYVRIPICEYDSEVLDRYCADAA